MIDDKKSQKDSGYATDASFPIILKTVKQAERESNTNKSLFKQDSLSSVDQSPNSQQKPNQIIEPAKVSQVDQLRKFIKKADDLNTFNLKKLQQQKQLQNFPKYQRSSGSLLRFSQDYSIQNIQQTAREKQIRRIYMSKQKKIPAKNYNVKSRYNIFAKSNHKKTNETKQVQTQRTIQPEKNQQMPINQMQMRTMKNFNTIQQLPIINPQKHRKNTISQLQYDDDQDKIVPKKNLKKKPVKGSTSFNQTNYQPAATFYLKNMSKNSHNLQTQFKIFAKQRQQQMLSSTVFNKGLEGSRGKPIGPLNDHNFSFQQASNAGLNIKTTKSRFKDTSSQFNFGKNKELKSTQKQASLDSNQKINTSRYKNLESQFNFGVKKEASFPQKAIDSDNINKLIMKNEQKAKQFHVITQELSVYAQKSSRNGRNPQYEQASSFAFNSHVLPNQSAVKSQQNKEVQKKQMLIQVPSVHEIKVGKGQTIGKQHFIHPVRNNFGQNEVDWITNQFNPKANIIKKIDLKNFQIKKYRNGVYFGQLNQQGQKNGKGIVFYYNGRVYQGEFIDDLKQGKGYQGFPDGSSFKGQFHKGVKQGKGCFQWGNGEVYDGQWKNGKKNGSGMWKSIEGQSYIGQWKNGKVQGFGVFVMKNGDRYEGQFVNSLKHGLGTQRYHTGQTYVGEFRKNRPFGSGQYYWANGNYYKGQFTNGLRHGEGTFKNVQQKTTYQGQFQNDKMCGYGQLKNEQTGQVYIGNFQNNLKHGYGDLYLNQTELFKGYWINGDKVDKNGFPIIQEEIQRQQSIKNVLPAHNKKKLIGSQKSKSKSIQKNIGGSKNKSKSPDNLLDRSENYKKSCNCTRKH